MKSVSFGLTDTLGLTDKANSKPYDLTIRTSDEESFTIIATPKWKVKDLRDAIRRRLIDQPIVTYESSSSRPSDDSSASDETAASEEYYALYLGSVELLDEMSFALLKEIKYDSAKAEIWLKREQITATYGDRRYAIFEKIGTGCFSTVHRGRDLTTGKSVAVKIEPETTAFPPQLDNEAEIMRMLQGQKNLQGFAEMLHLEGSPRRTCLVMDLLGMTLEEYTNRSGGCLECKNVVLVAEQALRRLEYLHSKGFIHRDVKPENFAFGRGSKCLHLYLIDFGLSKTFLSFPGLAHIPFRQKLLMVGTARYASINSHKGMEQSRRDDLEALGHVFFQLLRGNLPWSAIDSKSRAEKTRRIMVKKEATPIKKLCDAYPDEFGSYLEYARSLDFDQVPDYIKLYRFIQAIRTRMGPWKDHQFPWVSRDPKPETIVPVYLSWSSTQPEDLKNQKRPAKKSMLNSLAGSVAKTAGKGLSLIGMGPVSGGGARSKVKDNISSPTSKWGVRESLLTRFGLRKAKKRKQETASLLQHRDLAAQAMQAIQEAAPLSTKEKDPPDAGKYTQQQDGNKGVQPPASLPKKQPLTWTDAQRVAGKLENLERAQDAESEESEEEGGEEETKTADECVEPSDGEVEGHSPGGSPAKQVAYSNKDAVKNLETDEESSESFIWCEGEETAEEEEKEIDECVEPSDEELHEIWKDKYRGILKGSWKDKEMNLRPITRRRRRSFRRRSGSASPGGYVSERSRKSSTKSDGRVVFEA